VRRKVVVTSALALVAAAGLLLLGRLALDALARYVNPSARRRRLVACPSRSIGYLMRTDETNRGAR
jgi:hypothetical protein